MFASWSVAAFAVEASLKGGNNLKSKTNSDIAAHTFSNTGNIMQQSLNGMKTEYGRQGQAEGLVFYTELVTKAISLQSS